MKKFDKAAMIANFLEELNVPDTVEEPVEVEGRFNSELSQSLSDDLHRDILAITLRLVSNAARANDLHIVDRGIDSLIESLVIIASTYSETDEEVAELVNGYVEKLLSSV